MSRFLLFLTLVAVVGLDTTIVSQPFKLTFYKWHLLSHHGCCSQKLLWIRHFCWDVTHSPPSSLVPLMNPHCHLINTIRCLGWLPWIFHLNGLGFHFWCLNTKTRGWRWKKKTWDKKLCMLTILESLYSPFNSTPGVYGSIENKCITFSSAKLVHIYEGLMPFVQLSYFNYSVNE